MPRLCPTADLPRRLTSACAIHSSSTPVPPAHSTDERVHNRLLSGSIVDQSGPATRPTECLERIEAREEGDDRGPIIARGTTEQQPLRIERGRCVRLRVAGVNGSELHCDGVPGAAESCVTLKSRFSSQPPMRSAVYFVPGGWASCAVR